MNKTVRDIDLSDSELLRNCENIFTEPSKKPIPKKVAIVTRSKQKRHSSVNLHKRFMKNNRPTHCQEEIIKQGKVVCGLETTEELPVEEVSRWAQSDSKSRAIRVAGRHIGPGPFCRRLGTNLYCVK